ncbi:Gamma carbonic anhydrase 1 [Diplonema papillatum]|nr:Gamma carbonic anhydrase 1 [Diplonema papillatum]
MLNYFFRGFGLACREGAYHLDKFGCLATGTSAYKEQVVSWKRLQTFEGRSPVVEHDCFIAPNCNVIGSAHLGSKVGLFYQTVIRADIRDVQISANTTVQDRCVIRCTPASECFIGSHVTIEPGCMITGCHIADDVFIGSGTTIMEGARVESQSIVAPGSVVQKFAVVPSGELWAGVPAEKVRDLTEEEITSLRASAIHGTNLAQAHKEATEKSFMQEDEEETVLREWGHLESFRTPLRAPYGQFDAGPIGSGTHLNIPGQVMTPGGVKVHS